MIIRDLAGGRLTFHMTDGTHMHRQVLRVTQFGRADAQYDIPLAVAAGKLNFAGDARAWDTANAWLTMVSRLYAATWTLSLVKAETREGGTADTPYNEVAVPGSVAPRPGVSGINTLPDATTYVQQTWTGKDIQGNRARIVLLGTNYWLGRPLQVPGSGSAEHDGTWTFCTDANHPVVSHHGQAITGGARVVSTFNRRARRRYGYA